MRQLVLGIWLVASLGVRGQQPDAPVPAGSAGLAPLQFATYIPVEYPLIALSAQVSGEVVLQARIASSGRVDELRAVRSIPLLDQAAFDGVRRWRFEPPMIQGVPTAVTVPIRIVFEHHSGFAAPAVPALSSASLPKDFVVVYASNCPDSGEFEFNTGTGTYVRTHSRLTVRVVLALQAKVLEEINDAITRTGLLSEETRLERWPDQPPAPQISDDTIRVWVHGRRAPLDFYTDAPARRQYVLDVRSNGTWTRLSPPDDWKALSERRWLEGKSLEIDQRVRHVVDLIEQRVRSEPVARSLPREQQWCRWPR